MKGEHLLAIQRSCGILLLFTAIVSASLVWRPADAQDAIGEIVATATIGGMLDKAESSVNSIVDNAGEEARATIMEAARQMRLLIANMRVAYADSLDQTFESIGSERQKLFQNAWQTIEEIDASAKDSLKQANQIATLGASAIKDLPFSDSSPRVYQVNPLYITKRQIDAKKLLVIQGALLAEGEPSLRMEGDSLQPAQKIDTTLSFLFPTKLPFQKNVNSIVAELVTYEQQGWFDRLLNRDLKERRYSVPIFLVPESLGVAQVTWKRQIEYEEEKTLRCPTKGNHTTKSKKFKGSSRSGPNCPLPAGWTPDPDSLKFVKSKDTHCEERSGHVDDASFGYRVTCNAYGGSCYAEGAFRDHCKRGEYRGHVTLRVFRPKKKPASQSVEPESVSWGKSVEWQGPKDTVGFTLTVKKIDGQERKIVRGSEKDPWFSVSFNDQTKQLVLDPKEVGEALEGR